MAAVGLAVAAALGFGSAAIFARVAMQRASPLSVIFVSLVSSFAVSAALALAFAFSDLITLPPVVLAWCLLLGVMNFVGGRNLSYMAISRIGASRAAAIVSTSTVFAAILAITLTGERPHVLVAAGTVVVVGGLAAAMGRGILEGHTVGRTALTGYLLAFAAAACYGGTNVVAKELTHELTSPLVVSSISLFFGTLLLLPVAGRPAMARLRQTRGFPELRRVRGPVGNRRRDGGQLPVLRAAKVGSGGDQPHRFGQSAGHLDAGLAVFVPVGKRQPLALPWNGHNGNGGGARGLGQPALMAWRSGERP